MSTEPVTINLCTVIRLIVTEEVDNDSFIHNTVINNAFILDITRNWSQLEFLEAYYIKKLNPKINNGLKASKELQLFW